MIKGYIFDFGGTIDTAGCHWGKTLWHSYQRQGVPVDEERFREAYVHVERMFGRNDIIKTSFTFRKMLDVKIRMEMEYLCTSGAWEADEEEFTGKHDLVLNDLYKQTSGIVAHSRETLVKLRQDYPMVLVTNFYGNMSEVLREFHLDNLFDSVVESAVVGVRKPDARIFTLGIKALNLNPGEVMVVGDSFYKDIEPAHGLGCKTTWLKGEGWTDKVYDETIPDEIITDLAQLVE